MRVKVGMAERECGISMLTAAWGGFDIFALSPDPETPANNTTRLDVPA